MRELLGGRYRLGTTIAAGGMSTVHRGWDTVLQRAVAVKLYLPNLDEATRRRFEEEARTLGALSHPGLVAVYDSGVDEDSDEGIAEASDEGPDQGVDQGVDQRGDEGGHEGSHHRTNGRTDDGTNGSAGSGDGGRPYLVMQLIDGQNLRDRLAGGPLAAHEVRALGARLAEVLAYVHAQGVIHRDVKPSNVLLDAHGTAYLADFGISRAVDGTRLTATGQFVGTAGYLAPEQVLGEDVGPAADVYALGLVLLECLTGQAEYSGSDVEMAVARLNRPPRIPGDIPLDLASAVGAMTLREPHKRPTAAECAAYLYNALADARPPNRTITAVLAHRLFGNRRLGSWLPGRWSPDRRSPGRHRRLSLAASARPAAPRLAAGAAAAVTLLAGGFGWAALTSGAQPVLPVTVDSAPPASLVAPMPVVSTQEPVNADATPAPVAPAADPASEQTDQGGQAGQPAPERPKPGKGKGHGPPGRG